MVRSSPLCTALRRSRPRALLWCSVALATISPLRDFCPPPLCSTYKFAFASGPGANYTAPRPPSSGAADAGSRRSALLVVLSAAFVAVYAALLN